MHNQRNDQRGKTDDEEDVEDVAANYVSNGDVRLTRNRRANGNGQLG
jgi:hypothetical protein